MADYWRKLADTVKHNVLSTEQTDLPLTVLISTGALNPVHKGHVRMLQLAANALQSTHAVVGCALSPSHTSYVQSKGLSHTFSAKDRCRMIDAACSEEDGGRLLCCDSWECDQTHFVDFPSVRRSLEQRLNTELADALQGRKLQVKYVCGEDHVHKCRLYYANWVVCIRRTHEFGNNWPEDVRCTLVEGDPSLLDASSTAVRKALQDAKTEEELRQLLAPLEYQSVTEDLIRLHFNKQPCGAWKCGVM
eukprot:TRINITY_DN75679_c0_g1_i1.p1 TRINITY_DN75679_c0_g1~~TRINITY_DN75679_c0_g1_i1.p1  ORF type:complete len:248 (+),score=15.50 TRINITY_DN75679_c0_g1_i1:95-838(+)